MSQNLNISDLSPTMIANRVYDPANDAVRIQLGEASFAISLDATGDSVSTQGVSLSQSTSTLTSASTGIILAEVAVVGLKTFNLYTKTLTTIVGPQVCTLEISPTDTGDVWVASSLTVTPSLTANAVVAGTPATIVARRARVRIAAGITSGTFVLYLIAQGS